MKTPLLVKLLGLMVQESVMQISFSMCLQMKWALVDPQAQHLPLLELVNWKPFWIGITLLCVNAFHLFLTLLLNYLCFRPFAGFANFCPDQLAATSDEDNIVVATHEIFHALVSSY